MILVAARNTEYSFPHVMPRGRATVMILYFLKRFVLQTPHLFHLIWNEWISFTRRLIQKKVTRISFAFPLTFIAEKWPMIPTLLRSKGWEIPTGNENCIALAVWEDTFNHCPNVRNLWQPNLIAWNYPIKMGGCCSKSLFLSATGFYDLMFLGATGFVWLNVDSWWSAAPKAFCVAGIQPRTYFFYRRIGRMEKIWLYYLCGSQGPLHHISNS